MLSSIFQRKELWKRDLAENPYSEMVLDGIRIMPVNGKD
jgi:hypothetical protein